MGILELVISQFIEIRKDKYKVVNKVEFTEKSSKWYEYKLQNMSNSKYYYLNVELDYKTVLYDILNPSPFTKNDLKTTMEYNGIAFQMFECGRGEVSTYAGLTDVGLNEKVSYYEYKALNNDRYLLSIEIWKDDFEVSIGHQISLSEIKILKEFDY